ncbi:YraN family protein [Micrococcoides hystricis]|uniref:UPF0102 protein ACFFFR_10010 n=1 Tax=Micrococcoides hystricis TaxID=1572761 RepID=A0ABV6PCZ2_9MICC
MTQEQMRLRIPEQSHRQRLGRCGEFIAANYLQALHYRILDQNWTCRSGEIDLVGYGEDHLVFVEVKARTGLDFGHPLEAITEPKFKRLCRLAAYWRKKQQHKYGFLDRHVPQRIDVIGIVFTEHGLELSHQRGIDVA